MQLALCITIAALVAIVAAGCRAVPTPAAPQANEPESTRSVAAPTRRYLRTENVAPSNEPPRYVDVLELRNVTDKTLGYTELSGGLVTSAVEVLIADRGWTDAFDGMWCRFGSRRVPVAAGELATVRLASWLRPTRVSRYLREVVDVPGYQPNEATLQSWLATSEPFDSSLAAPGVPPVLTWEEEIARGG